ncbi:MAG: hypothetical protein HPY66_2525 [Firmicutes bacterium]|nr:hypothetical protein [Bacillota bacterium]MDI6705080.1 peptidoglycan-binding domain-containing protein [Bacillota bacterium]
MGRLGRFIIPVLCVMVFSLPVSASAMNSILKFGSEGSDVTLLQELLIEKGYLDCEATGYYGPLTTQAVMNFQTDYNLVVDGIAGPQTFEALMNGQAMPPGEEEGSSEIPEVGEYLDWFDEVQYIFKDGTVAVVTDIDTGLSFKVMKTFGHEHADSETLTAEDTAILKKIWGGWSWERRAIIVSIGDKHIAASATAMPHAGNDKYPALQTISSRSGGYGRGTNLDKIKGNDMDGVICIHFKNSRLHKNNAIDPDHQKMVKKAAGLL